MSCNCRACSCGHPLECEYPVTAPTPAGQARADRGEAAPTRYLIAETSTHDEARIIADWDGEIHQTREAAEAELWEANGRGKSSCCDGAHWRLYAVTPVAIGPAAPTEESLIEQVARAMYAAADAQRSAGEDATWETWLAVAAAAVEVLRGETR